MPWIESSRRKRTQSTERAGEVSQIEHSGGSTRETLLFCFPAFLPRGRPEQRGEDEQGRWLRTEGIRCPRKGMYGAEEVEVQKVSVGMDTQESRRSRVSWD